MLPNPPRPCLTTDLATDNVTGNATDYVTGSVTGNATEYVTGNVTGNATEYALRGATDGIHGGGWSHFVNKFTDKRWAGNPSKCWDLANLIHHTWLIHHMFITDTLFPPRICFFVLSTQVPAKRLPNANPC